MPAGLASLVLQAQAFFTIILGAFVFGERLQASSWRGSRWRSSACWCWWREPRRGACPTGGLYADPGRRRSAGLRQYFQQKNHVPGDPPANHIAGGVERIDPGAAVYVCLVAIDGPQLMLASLRQIDMLTVLCCFTWRLSPPSSAMVSGARCWGAMKPGGWRRCRCWCR